MDKETEDLFKEFTKALSAKNVTPQNTIQIDLEKELKDIHKHTSKNKTLIIHIMNNKKDQVGQVKTKIYKTEFNWKGRAYPILQDAIWYDLKGIGHAMCDTNMSDGTIRFLSAEQLNLVDFSKTCDKCNRHPPIDMCENCGGSISYDAKAVFDMHRRKQITTFWGIDQSHIVLLLIMGIIAIGGFGGLMYMIGENQNKDKAIQNQIKINNDLQNKLNEYLQPLPSNEVIP